MKKNLFVCGSPRSGTTAVWRFLVSEPRIIMGVERYGNLFFNQPLKKDLFEKERFFDLRDGDTFYNDLKEFNVYYEEIKDKFDEAIFYGDKIPLLYNYIDSLFGSIPDAKVIIIIRNIIDVASSYESRAADKGDTSWSPNKRTQSAIDDWRQSIKVVSDYIGDHRVLPIIYEDFFSDVKFAKALCNNLGLGFSENQQRVFNGLNRRHLDLEGERSRVLDMEAVKLICETAPFGLYRDVLNSIRDNPNYGY